MPLLQWFNRKSAKRCAVSAPKMPGRSISFEILEDRFTPAVFSVLGNGDTTGAVTEVSPGQYTAPTLRAAIDAANDELNHAGADTIVFDLPTGQETIFAILDDTTNPNAYGPTAFVIASNITIQGNPNEPGVIIDGNGSHRLFAVMSGCTLTLEYVTLSGGHAQGGDGGDGTGNGGGGGAGLGGAIFNEGTLNIRYSTLNNNAAQGGAGGASNQVIDTAGSGGGMGSNGQTSGPGGGPNGGAFAGGAGGFGGGGGAGGDSGSATNGGNGGFGGGGGGVAEGIFSGGTGGFGGGGSFGSAGGFGGGAGNGGAGGGAGMGGAIFNHAGSVTITNSTIAGNTATGGAGGAGGASGIPGRGLGGGIFNRAGTLSITNTTIADNTVAGDGSNDGGGIYSLSDGGTATVTLVNAIIAANITDADIINHQTTGTATLTATAPNIVETLIVNTGGTVNDSGVINATPLLGALANNGGPTRTMLPGLGSPAIDAGDNTVAQTLATDQRGGAYARQIGLVDIGAVEAPLWGHARFIANLYADVLGRAPDAAGYRSWVGVADTVGNRQAIADAFWESAEHRSNQIDSWYQEFLTRNPDAPGKNGWLGLLLTGGTEEQVVLGILNSAEYQALNPTDTGFVTALYNDLLARDPETAALNDWSFALGQGTTRAQVIDAIVDSLEHAERWVIQFYQVYLDRTPDAGTSRTWALAVQADQLTLQDAAEQILASDEYFLLSP